MTLTFQKKSGHMYGYGFGVHYQFIRKNMYMSINFENVLVLDYGLNPEPSGLLVTPPKSRDIK